MLGGPGSVGQKQQERAVLPDQVAQGAAGKLLFRLESEPVGIPGPGPVQVGDRDRGLNVAVLEQGAG
jgi:hypothetical protein